MQQGQLLPTPVVIQSTPSVTIFLKLWTKSPSSVKLLFWEVCCHSDKKTNQQAMVAHSLRSITWGAQAIRSL
ncbi:rCG34075, isoform CRA_a [Rattus norvegicus]|uniref:RCG34075, isoform CRA_a n=1 Tax=Rattus norvegicus TaxID=10116 RepID=A6HJL8_RAT|nr:rCG34075, isoform CRA_a [Rattus norvegicus]EDM06223.1 rCG34075, isoform CRA_a [Rattus norvegicus]